MSANLSDGACCNPATLGSRSSLDQTFGLIQIGKAKVALPVAAIREVVQGQRSYGTLPVKAEGLLGAVDIRGTIVPVLDLRPMLGWPEDDDDSHVIIVLRCDGYLIGLRAERVSGVIQCKSGDLSDLTVGCPESSEILLTRAFENGDEIVSILDPSRIVNRPGLPKVLEKIEQRVAANTVAETVLLFSHGRAHLGIDADCIDAAVPDASILKSAMSAGFCLGTIEHRGYDVPVVDTTAVAGLGLGPRPSTTAVIVIRFGDKTMLGLAVDTVRDIVPVTPDALIAMPMQTWEGAALFRGMLLCKEQPHHLVLDVDDLRRHPELSDLAQLCRPRLRLQVADAGPPGRGAASDRGERYLVYSAGGDVATRLDQITEVLLFPSDVAPFANSARGILGLFTHRRRLVPLISLERILTDRDRDIDTSTARVLFVESDGRYAAFVVESLISIETAHPDQFSACRENALMDVPIVMLGHERRLVSYVDLARRIEDIYSGAIRDDGDGIVATETVPMDVVPLKVRA